jgi:long-chain acyl-CoA synthetase
MFIDSMQLQHYPNLLHIGFTSGTTGLPKAYYRDEDSWLASFEVNNNNAYNVNEYDSGPGAAMAFSFFNINISLTSKEANHEIGQTTFHPEKLLNQCRKISSYKVAMFLVPTMIKLYVHCCKLTIMI